MSRRLKASKEQLTEEDSETLLLNEPSELIPDEVHQQQEHEQPSELGIDFLQQQHEQQHLTPQSMKKQKMLSSSIWQYFDKETFILEDGKKESWAHCKNCPAKYKVNNGTSACTSHLEACEGVKGTIIVKNHLNQRKKRKIRSDELQIPEDESTITNDNDETNPKKIKETFNPNSQVEVINALVANYEKSIKLFEQTAVSEEDKNDLKQLKLDYSNALKQQSALLVNLLSHTTEE